MSGTSIPHGDFDSIGHKFIWTEAHRRAAGQLEFAVNSLTHITLMLGKPGVGKSRLVEEVVEYVMVDQAVAFFTDPRLLDEDLVGTVRKAVMGLADTYTQNETPIFVIDDAHRLHHDTLTKLLRMSHPPDGGGVVFKLVLVAHSGFDQDMQSIAPGDTGPAFELWPLDEKDANFFVDEWLRVRGHGDIFDDEDQRKRMLDRAEGIPGALVGALEWHLRKGKSAAPKRAKPFETKADAPKRQSPVAPAAPADSPKAPAAQPAASKSPKPKQEAKVPEPPNAPDAPSTKAKVKPEEEPAAVKKAAPSNSQKTAETTRSAPEAQPKAARKTPVGAPPSTAIDPKNAPPKPPLDAKPEAKPLAAEATAKFKTERVAVASSTKAKSLEKSPPAAKSVAKPVDVPTPAPQKPARPLNQEVSPKGDGKVGKGANGVKSDQSPEAPPPPTVAPKLPHIPTAQQAAPKISDATKSERATKPAAPEAPATSQTPVEVARQETTTEDVVHEQAEKKSPVGGVDLQDVGKEEPEGLFRLERAVKKQQDFKKDRQQEADREKLVWPDISLDDADPAEHDAEPEEEPVAEPLSSRAPPAPRRNVTRGASIAGLGVLIVAGALLYPRFAETALPTLATLPAAAPEDVSETVLEAPVMPGVVELPEDATRILRSAVDLGRTDESAAAAAYAVAAAKGESRAAYYLGQMYEAGEGVAQDPTAALRWYNAAGSEIGVAAERADAIRSTSQTGDVTNGELVITHAHIDASDHALILWDAEKLRADVKFELEFADSSGVVLTGFESNVPAAYVSLPENAKRFRVVSGENEQRVASEWVTISAN